MKKNNTFSRREFLKLSGMASIPLTLGGFPLFSQASTHKGAFDTNNDKILVLVQLQGGNDGLATIYHDDEYANLQTVRSNIIVPQSSILNVSGKYGFHPNMGGMKDLWNDGKLGIIQNVGYPNQNRSHFRSTDIWHSASEASVYESSGWIGRFYDLEYSDYPNGYPNSTNPHPFALTIGKIVSETCQGASANYSLALTDPFNPGTAVVGATGNIPADCYGDALTFINDTVRQTNAFASVISTAANAGNNLSSKYATAGTQLSEKLKHVARLISGGLQTKIYIVQLGGFDTHDNQTVSGANTTGRHAELLQELSDALCAFQDDLELLGLEDRVIGMTYSEFGRRIRSNGSLGTDHGTAAPMFVFGSCIKNQILGDHPEIDTQVGIEEGVAMQYDFRNVYGTLLSQWLGATETEVRNIINPNFSALPVIESACVQTTDIYPSLERNFKVDVYPNPCVDNLQIGFMGNNENMKITLYNAMGSVIRVLTNQLYGASEHTLFVNVSDLPAGAYFLHLESKGISKTKKLIKL
jgi:uncharacterized protein (DUF1501 family)